MEARSGGAIKKTIAFVRAAKYPNSRKRSSSAGILASERQLNFPSHIAATTLRPDIVLVSESTMQVVLLELTVLWEDRLDETFERKLPSTQNCSVTVYRMES